MNFDFLAFLYVAILVVAFVVAAIVLFAAVRTCSKRRRESKAILDANVFTEVIVEKNVVHV